MADEVMMRIDDLWEGEMRAISALGTKILIANIKGTIVAVEDRCPHKGVPLSHGKLEGGNLTCSAHGWSFNLCNGCGINPRSDRLNTFKVRNIKDGIIAIDISARISARHHVVSNDSNAVGPVLLPGEVSNAIITAIRECNARVDIVDRGGYLRVSSPDRCELREEAVSHWLGRSFRLPTELERVMPSFQGRMTIENGTVTWLNVDAAL